MARRRLSKSLIFLVAFLLLPPGVVAPAAPPSGTLRVDSDLELLGFGQLSGGGKMTWILSGEQATLLRRKVIAFFDETFVVPTPFVNMPSDQVWRSAATADRNNGILDEAEAGKYADFLARYLTGGGITGFDYRYTRLTAANRLQQGLAISQSSTNLVGANNLTADALELKFWFNAYTVGSDFASALSETRFANALHEVFTVRYNQTFIGGFFFPNTKPFDIQAGDAWWVDPVGGYAANGNRSALPVRYNASASQETASYLTTSTRPFTGPDYPTPIDLRFATTARITLEFSAAMGTDDRLRVEACPFDPYVAGPCTGPWQVLSTTLGDQDLRGTNIAQVQSVSYDLDPAANDLLGQRWTLRLNFTAGTNTANDGEGVRVHRLAVNAPSYAQGQIVNNHADFLVGTANLNGWVLVAGGGNYIRTPAGVVGLYSNTFDAGAVPSDSVRFQQFDFLENQQVLFALVIVCAYLQSWFHDKFYLESKAKFPIRQRASATRIPWLLWTGRLVILFMILWYFFPGMFAALGLKMILPGAFLWAWSLGGCIGMTLVSWYLYRERAAKAPAAAEGATPVCSHCFDPMTDAADRFKCECGERYHAHCAATLSACANCGRAIQVTAPGPARAPQEVVCPSCGVANQAPQGADLGLERCQACASPLKPLQRGYNYLVFAATPEPAYRWFNGLVSQGVPGLILSKTFPEKLKREYTLTGAEMFWISDTTPGPKILDPRRLDFEVMRAFSNFAKTKRGGCVMLDGIEYLVVENGFDKVFKWIKKVNDLSGPNEITLLVPVAPNSLEPEAMTMLMKEFDRIEQLSEGAPAAPPAPPAAPPPPPPEKPAGDRPDRL